MSNKNPKINKSKEKGVALIITFFVMTIMLSIVLGIGAILFIEIKTIRGLGNSVVAFYTADTGIEKTLYYDRKVIPEGAERGLCNICNSCGSDCQSCGTATATGYPCDTLTCNDCIISYNSEFNGKKYQVEATIVPAGEDSDTTLKSFGTFQGTTRGIELVFSGVATDGTAPQAPMIVNAHVEPLSDPFGVEIFADISDPDGVASAIAYIYRADGYETSIDLLLTTGNTYSNTWTGPEGAYFVDIVACDMEDPPNCSGVEDI